MLSERSQAHQNIYCTFHVYDFQVQAKLVRIVVILRGLRSTRVMKLIYILLGVHMVYTYVRIYQSIYFKDLCILLHVNYIFKKTTTHSKYRGSKVESGFQMQVVQPQKSLFYYTIQSQECKPKGDEQELKITMSG